MKTDHFIKAFPFETSLSSTIAPVPLALDIVVQGSTGIYNVIYTGLSLKIFKNVIYTERYIYRMASTNFL